MEKKQQLIDGWLKKAGHDLGMAKLALESGVEFTDSICFHCQQFVEKTLKAYLICIDVDLPKTHSLAYLLDLIADKETVNDELYQLSEILEDYSVGVRYPADTFEPTPNDAEEAYAAAEKVKEIFKTKF